MMCVVLRTESIRRRHALQLFKRRVGSVEQATSMRLPLEKRQKNEAENGKRHATYF